MPPIDIYVKMMCPYCTRAKSLLKKKGADFNEIDITFSGDKRQEMHERSGGGRTVPQIFIGQTYVGGCDELLALDAEGGLDPLLAGEA
ncbi:MAG: glutaredoxin 3 [Pseudomonadota bacterium]